MGCPISIAHSFADPLDQFGRNFFVDRENVFLAL